MIRPQPWKHIRPALYAVCKHFGRAFAISLTGVRYFNVPDLEGLGGVLIVANHQSYLDPLLVGMAFPRPISYLAQEELFRVPGFGRLIRALGTHSVRRSGADPSAVRMVMRILRGGEPLLLFPEGTRTWDGTLGRFRPGVGAIAVRCRVPLLPICIEGAFKCWPRTRTLPMPARVAVAFGELLWPGEADGRSLTAALAERIALLQRSLRLYLAREQ